MAGDPADVRGAPVDVGVGFEVEDGPMSPRRLGQIAAGGVQDSFGLPGGALGVQNEERMLAVEELRLVLNGLGG